MQMDININFTDKSTVHKLITLKRMNEIKTNVDLFQIAVKPERAATYKF